MEQKGFEFVTGLPLDRRVARPEATPYRQKEDQPSIRDSILLRLCCSLVAMSESAVNQSLLIIVSGPAGSGKTTLCERLAKEFSPQVKQVVTATTRPPREGEREGFDYTFLSQEAFEAKVQAGEFYEHASVHTHRYGTLKIEIERGLSSGIDLLLNIDVQGAAAYRRAAKDDSNLANRLLTLFIRLKDLKQAEERLLKRGKDSPEEIARRLETAESELEEWSHFNHSFISGSKEEDYQKVRCIYLRERTKRGS